MTPPDQTPPSPTASVRAPARRPLLTVGAKIGLAVIASGVLLDCMGLPIQGLIQFAFTIAVGWFGYLRRVVPAARVSWGGVATAVVCLAGVLVLGHATAAWLFAGRMAAPPGPGASADAAGSSAGAGVFRWKFRHTLTAVGVVVLLFVSGLATVGVAHQAVWLARSPEPIFRYRSYGAAKVQCAANLSSLYKGCYLFANEHQGRFPDSLAELILWGGDDMLSAALFVCPASDGTKPEGATAREWGARVAHGHSSYVYHGRGMTMAGTTAPGAADVPVACEPLANHGVGMNVVFADGHVDWVPAERARGVLGRSPSGADRE